MNLSIRIVVIVGLTAMLVLAALLFATAISSTSAQTREPRPTPSLPLVEVETIQDSCGRWGQYCYRRIVDHEYGLVCYQVDGAVSCVKMP